MTTRTIMMAAASLLALAITPTAQAQDTGATSAQGGSETTLRDGIADQPEAQASNDIIVTASKRAERLQDVPAAITALSGDTIDELGLQSFRDYASLVPGLSQRDNGAPGSGTIILRGLNSGPQQLTNTSAFYIDDIPFSSSGFLSAGALLTPSPELAEVERIEVLKGPQGTLYGASNLGGLIRIITKKPDLNRFYGSATGEVSTVEHGETGFLVRGTINAPIVKDLLALSATGYYRRAPGFTDNVGTGTENVNRSNLYGGRLALRLEPSPDLTVTVSGIYQDIDNLGYAAQTLQPGGRSFAPRFGEYVYSNFRDFGAELRYRLANATVDYDAGFGTLTATASYGRYESELNSDGTAVYIPAARGVLAPIAQAVFGVPINTLLPANSTAAFLAAPSMDKYSGEVRFASKRLGPVEFLLGAFYTDESSRYLANVYVSDAAGVPAAAPRDVLVRSTTTSKYREIAGFGNLTVYVTDSLDVTGGIRYAENEQVAGTGGPGAILYYLPRASAEFDFQESATTYLATARWRPTRDFSVYLRAASGYRPGGPQTNPTPPVGAQTIIRPDSVWNYEGGVKGSVLDGALSFDASAYHIDWSDIQLNSLVNGVVLQGNAASAKVDGFEMQLQAHPSPLLSVGANLGYTRARLDQIDPSAAAVTGARAGDALPLTPEYTAAVLVDHAVPLGGDVAGNLGATLRFQSDMPSTFPALNPNRTQKLPEITTIDLRGSVDFGRFSVQARVDNLLDKLGFTNVGNDGAIVIRPRTFTLGFTADF